MSVKEDEPGDIKDEVDHVDDVEAGWHHWWTVVEVTPLDALAAGRRQTIEDPENLPEIDDTPDTERPATRRDGRGVQVRYITSRILVDACNK